MTACREWASRCRAGIGSEDNLQATPGAATRRSGWSSPGGAMASCSTASPARRSPRWLGRPAGRRDRLAVPCGLRWRSAGPPRQGARGPGPGSHSTVLRRLPGHRCPGGSRRALRQRRPDRVRHSAPRGGVFEVTLAPLSLFWRGAEPGSLQRDVSSALRLFGRQVRSCRRTGTSSSAWSCGTSGAGETRPPPRIRRSPPGSACRPPPSG